MHGEEARDVSAAGLSSGRLRALARCEPGCEAALVRRLRTAVSLLMPVLVVLT